MKSIDVIVNTEGQVSIEAIGFTGSACVLATKALEEAMGVAGKKDKKKEFYQQAVGKQAVGGGK